MIHGTQMLILLALLALSTGCGDSPSPTQPPEPPVDTTGTTPPPPATTGDIRLNAATRYQTIVGWEAHSESGQDDAPFASYRNTLFDRAVNELGITRLRLEPVASLEHTQDLHQQWLTGAIDNTQYRCTRYSTINDNSDPFTINWNGFKFSRLDKYIDDIIVPMRQRLSARGESLYLVATYVAFVNHNCAGTQYHHDDSPEEYAEFVLATYLHMQQKYGFVPDAWEVILEPDNTPFWRGTQIGQAIVAAANRLQQNGFTPRFIGPSTARPANAPTYFDGIAAVAGATSRMTELSYHRYGSVTEDLLRSIASRAAQHNLKTSMLEHMGSGHEDLHSDLKFANVSAWQQFALAFPTTDNGAQYYLINTSGTSATVQLASRSRFLRQYFNYVRPGAVRIEAQTTRSGLDPLAFINSSGKYVVVVKANAQASFTVGGLPAGTYGVSYATGTASNSAADVAITAGQVVSASIPAAGVLTIYRK